ncbi:MAG: hypothetical protein PSN34_11775, partial [Urechidicola sp.]|nr:hypothetical protein [Urechidicola sp.]
MKKRGAKIKLLKSLDSELNQAQTFKNFIIEVLNLKSENDEDINYICSVAHGFEESLNDTGASKIVGDRRFKAHMRHEELTDKSLTTCIYYLFEKGTSPKSIEIGISKLLHGIEITQGKKLYIKINGLIRTCVRYKIKEDEIAERRVGNDSVIYNRLFPDDWNIVIDSDWKYETTHYKIEKNNLSDNNIGVNSQKSKKIPESKKSGFNKWKYLIISLIIIGVLYFLYPKTFTNEEPEPDKITELNSMEYITPLFDKNDKRYKLMIIPFNQECNYKGALNDIGKVIEMRLEDLSKKDSLNLNVRYIDTLTPNKSKTDSTWAGYFERIMKENYANQIIYGATRENNCTSSSFNEICINYIIDIDRSLKHKSENTNYKFYSTSREAITQGKLQENIDFVIYMNAIYSLDIENISKGLKYVNKIIDSLDVSQNNLLKAYYERMRLNSYNNFFSDIVRADAEFIIKNDSAKTLPIDSRIDVKIKLGDSSV